MLQKVVASPGLSFRKRDPGERSNTVPVNECEGIGLGTIFSDLPSKMVRSRDTCSAEVYISKCCKVNVNVEDFANKLKSAIPEFNN